MVHVGDLCDPVTDPPHGDWSKVNILYGGPWLLASCHVSLKFLLWSCRRSRNMKNLKKKERKKERENDKSHDNNTSSSLIVYIISLIAFVINK